jgi:LmbE family N-acetylglucosaminyl deacetylase
MLKLDCERVLVIAPHPDDEVFGCGGTIQRLKDGGASVYVLFVTVGTTKDFSARGESTAIERLEEIEKVSEFYGFTDYAMAMQGDEFHLQLDAVPQKEIVHAIERGTHVSFQSVKPDLVLTTSPTDYNQDHRAVYLATMTAARPQSPERKAYQPAILTYELPYQQWNVGEASPEPRALVRLSEADLQAKLDGLSLYSSQLKDPTNPLSLQGVETLARYRGLQCDSIAAEAFGIARITL